MSQIKTLEVLLKCFFNEKRGAFSSSSTTCYDIMYLTLMREADQPKQPS